MNNVFLIVIALPLALYLLVLLVNTVREYSPVPEIESPASRTEALEQADTAEVVPVVLAASEKVEPAVDSGVVVVPAIEAVAETVAPEAAPAPAEPLLSEPIAQIESVPAALATESVASEPPASQPTAEIESVTSPVAVASENAPNVADSDAAVAAQPEAEAAANAAILTAAAATETTPTAETAAEKTTTEKEPAEAEKKEELPQPVLTTLPDVDEEEDDSILSGESLILGGNGSPKFTFDYRGRLWVDKRNKGFFRQLRRPQMPPDEPT